MMSPAPPDASLTLAGARVVTPEGVIDDGWVTIRDGLITSVGAGVPPVGSSCADLQGAWLLPGFVDMHMHGGGGHCVTDSYAAMEAAIAHHRGHGTTTTLVSLMTAAPDDLVEQLSWAARLTRRGPSPRGHLVGAHLEGPFLSELRCGAQNKTHMLAPDPALMRRLLDAGEGVVRMVTLAPELDGALELVTILKSAGVIAAIGHTNAGYDDVAAAVAAGASQVTHLFNAMPPLHHRAPGVIGAALALDLPSELINDGHHLHPSVTGWACRVLSRPILITDAIDATGVPDGQFTLGGQAVTVSRGIARLSGTETLAGSTLTLDRAVELAITASGLSVEQAAAAAATNPARALGIDRVTGAISAGLAADLVVLDDGYRLVRVMAAGSWHAG